MDADLLAALRDGDAPEPAPSAPVGSAAEVPELAEAARVDPALGAGACPWLDAYAAFSRRWSPRAWEAFHEACGVWLLSVVAARRVLADLGGPRYTNLYVALAARTSLWAKSTTVKIAQQVLHTAGLDWLLAPDDSTPQRFISDLVLRVPEGYDTLTGERRKLAELRMAFPAQRGWFFEEWGQQVNAMLNASGFMADFRGILRRFDDCPERYQYATIGRGLDDVVEPYLALLASCTPADLRIAAAKHERMWADGFFARFAFVTPPEGANRSRKRFPEGERVVPAELSAPLVAWHQRLGVPEVHVESVKRKGAQKPELVPHVGAVHREVLSVAEDVRDAFYTYHDALLDLVEDGGIPDLDGGYARCAEKALRVALLLASVSGEARVEMRHWGRAQILVEGWRAGLHALYFEVNAAEPSEEEEKEEKVLQVVRRLEEPTANEVQRFVRGVSSREAAYILDGLVEAGALERRNGSRKGTIRYAFPD